MSRGEFLDIHQEGAVTVDVDHLLFGTAQLGTECRRITESHRTESGRGDQRAGFREIVILSRPHLVLAHARRDDRLSLG